MRIIWDAVGVVMRGRLLTCGGLAIRLPHLLATPPTLARCRIARAG
ncbi:MAG TPA: hypothetical protein VNY05_18175 [Candidatus Acidoferrales bacterium]|nr:hypothetical protein [Candidatus Acidoferrales bacterium]